MSTQLMKQALDAFLESPDFYELMQTYRHCKVDAVNPFEAIKSAICAAHEIAALKAAQPVEANPAPGYCKNCKDYTIEDPLIAQPVEPTATQPTNSQDWAGMDGATAFHLIERHSDNWVDAALMMDEWRLANITQPAPAALKAAQPVEPAVQTLQWTDAEGAQYAFPLEGATQLLAALYSAWPGGLNEIKAAMKNITQPAPAAPYQVPDGWQRVPLSATQEMMAAADEIEDLYKRGTPETWGKVYRAMISAAPKPTIASAPKATAAPYQVTDQDVAQAADDYDKYCGGNKSSMRAALEAHEARKATA